MHGWPLMFFSYPVSAHLNSAMVPLENGRGMWVSAVGTLRSLQQSLLAPCLTSVWLYVHIRCTHMLEQQPLAAPSSSNGSTPLIEDWSVMWAYYGCP
ncbi:hypothetical protein BKA93DRAFT_757156 [Sparassis latifolia]